MKHQIHMKRMNFTINSNCENMLRTLSLEKNLTMSDIIRRIIEEYYVNWEKIR